MKSNISKILLGAAILVVLGVGIAYGFRASKPIVGDKGRFDPNWATQK